MERLLDGAAAVAEAGAAALDAGCGDGRIARRLAAQGYQVLAVDRQAHPDWRPSGEVRFAVGDIREVALPGRARLVCLSGLLHYFADAAEVEAVLQKMSGFVAPGGRLIANWIDDDLPYPGGGAYLPGVDLVMNTLDACGMTRIEQWSVRADHVHPPHGAHAHSIAYAIWQRD